MELLDIHDRVAARLDKLLGIEKYRTLRKVIVEEEELNVLSIDNFMVISIAMIFKDKPLLDLFAEMCEIYGCCPQLFDENRNLHLDTMPPDVAEFFQEIFKKVNDCIIEGYFNSVKKN